MHYDCAFGLYEARNGIGRHFQDLGQPARK